MPTSIWASTIIQKKEREIIQYRKDSVHVPVLVFLAFGMNDGCDTEGIPHVEFVLVAPSLSSPQAVTFEGPPFYNQQPCNKEALDNPCREGIIVANVREVQKKLLKKK